MMNTSAFNPNSVHSEHNVVTVTHAHHQQPHSPAMANTGAPLGYHLHPQTTALQLPQSPIAPAMASAGGGSVGAAHSTTTLFDPLQLEKAYYSPSGTATTAPATAGGRFYTGGTSTGANSVTAAATQQHHHQHANTILITNNFAAQQQFATGPSQTQSTLTQRSPPLASGAHFGGNGSNIRIMTTLPSAAALQPNGSTQQQVYSIGKDVQQQHNDLLQLQQQQQQQHLYQQQQQHFATHSQHLPTILPQHFAAQHYATAQPQTSQQHAPAAMQLQLPPTPQQYYMPVTTADTSTHINAAAATAADKMLPTLPTLDGVGVGGRTVAMASAAAVTSAPAVATTPTSSTVVLDRINICINNHYTDSMASSSSSSAASSTIDINPTTLATSAHAQQPSPIIPAIHHKAVLDTGSSTGGLHIDAYASNDSTLVIDEPDSTTTTPHTPPTTPENSSPPPTVTQQPATTTTTTTQTSPSTNKEATTTSTTTAGERHAFAAISQCIVLEDDGDEEVIECDGDDEDECPPAQPQESVNPKQNKAVAAPAPAQQAACTEHATQEVTGATASEPQSTMQAPTTPPPVAMPASTLLTPSTPSSPTTPPAPDTAALNFAMGEDVFIRRDDGRFYLGTVINSALHEQHDQQLQYLVRFDDKSELWCGTDEMRKLGGGASSDSGGGNSNSATGRMCVACKRAQQQDVVEICERCGRGYHRNCTSETVPGSGIWWCKRCSKPMKVLPNGKRASVCRQLPYHVDALKWDEKHRVNEEQIYCYCGKTGQFDNHMLQCCKCQNWFHTQCMQSFNDTLLRGDGFFVFCCTICMDGTEYLRRLQMSWVDLLHLTLYNLSVMKKHHKFHHLVKDIVPFVLENRHTLPVPKVWAAMSQSELMKNITNALRENADRFLCGRECKRDPYFYALRNNGPPILPKMQVRSGAVLTDDLLTQTLKLKLHPVDKATNDHRQAQLQPPISHPTANSTEMRTFKSKDIAGNVSAPQHTADIYEFRIEDDEKFTSDDEIPIKHIIEKVRKSKGTPPAEKHSGSNTGSATKSKAKKYITPAAYEKLELNDENANDANCSLSLSLCLDSATTKRSPTKAHSEHSSKQATPKKDSSGAAVKSSSTKQAEQLPALSCANATAIISGVAVGATEKSSRKRKAFTLSKSYKEIAAEAAAKRYDSSRICDSSSDENSSSSRGTSLDVIIPPPKNFLGLNNPFRMVTPKKSGPGAQSGGSGQRSVNFGRGGNVIKSSIFNTTTLDFGSKLAALKSAGIFPNLSTSNLAKAAGQPRTVRTIKRRLSAKDITIGPNQEVRRRRTRRPSANVEVISTTTINPIPSNFFPIHAKDLFTTHAATTTLLTTYKHHHHQQQHHQPPPPPAQLTASSTSSSASSSPPASVTSSIDSQPEVLSTKPLHGRRLRQRPQKSSPGNSRRSSISSVSTSSNSSSNVALATLQQAANSSSNANINGTANGTDAASHIMQDLQQSVKEYFGAVNRIESGEQFSIRAKRQLANGQTQYLVEWGDATVPMPSGAATAPTAAATVGEIAKVLGKGQKIVCFNI